MSRAALGFGCASLTATGGKRESLHLLQCAYDEGIRYFDTARLYGMGIAEELLGEFSRSRRNQVTIATKLGITPPSVVRRLRPLVATGKAILRRVPGAGATVRRQLSSRVSSAEFTPALMQKSLEASLRALRTDYVDVLLLHEATVTQANDPSVLEFLANQVRAGQVRSHGVAGSFANLQGDCALFQAAHTVFQFNHNVMANNVSALRNCGGPDRRVVTYGALAPLQAISTGQAIKPVGSPGRPDVRDSSRVAGLLLAWAAATNPDGVVLFSSTNPKHIRNNVRAFNESHLDGDELEDLGESLIQAARQ
jgi:D-threo-aldose 1-dehydrogenase